MYNVVTDRDYKYNLLQFYIYLTRLTFVRF